MNKLLIDKTIHAIHSEVGKCTIQQSAVMVANELDGAVESTWSGSRWENAHNSMTIG